MLGGWMVRNLLRRPRLAGRGFWRLRSCRELGNCCESEGVLGGFARSGEEQIGDVHAPTKPLAGLLEP